MKSLITKELKIKFIETLNELLNFEYEEGNPFFINVGHKRYFVFLKNLTSAYFKNSPDITRVQLPYSNHFLKVLKADIPFIILGYDFDNDIFVCWNPKKIKERLNAKGNVSLYSRFSLQNNVKKGEFKTGFLSNGEKIILFRREELINFFDVFSDLFKDRQTKIGPTEPKIETINSSQKLIKITDKTLLQELTPILKKNRVLEAVEICMRFYKGQYTSMTFKDWFKLVNFHYREITSAKQKN